MFLPVLSAILGEKFLIGLYRLKDLYIVCTYDKLKNNSAAIL